MLFTFYLVPLLHELAHEIILQNFHVKFITCLNQIQLVICKYHIEDKISTGISSYYNKQFDSYVLNITLYWLNINAIVQHACAEWPIIIYVFRIIRPFFFPIVLILRLLAVLCHFLFILSSLLLTNLTFFSFLFFRYVGVNFIIRQGIK